MTSEPPHADEGQMRWGQVVICTFCSLLLNKNSLIRWPEGLRKYEMMSENARGMNQVCMDNVLYTFDPIRRSDSGPLSLFWTVLVHMWPVYAVPEPPLPASASY